MLVNAPVIKKWKVKDIRLAPYNPRIFPVDEVDKLEKSLSKYGYVNLLTVNKKTKNAVGGNQRLMALKKSTLQEIDVVEVDLNLEDEKLLNIALNKIGGIFDSMKLKEIFVDLGKTAELDLSLSGFHFPDIERIQNFGGLQITKKEPSEFEKDAENKLKAGGINVNINTGDKDGEEEDGLESFKSFDESIPVTKTCPKCQYSWS